MTTSPNLSATGDDQASPADPAPPRQNLAVAYLPLALVSFLILSFIAAAWTFVAAG